MTTPFYLKGRYREIKPTHESSLERFFTRFAWVVILVCAAFILLMVYRATVPPTIREIDHHIASDALKKKIIYHGSENSYFLDYQDRVFFYRNGKKIFI